MDSIKGIFKSRGMQLDMYRQRSELAPDEVPKKIIEFEFAVARLRTAQKRKQKCNHLAKDVDRILEEMGYLGDDELPF